MRLVCLSARLGISACLCLSPAYAETAVVCLENALPLETLGNDSDRREALLLQAETCMREGKPLRAAALLSQIIKSNPTDAEAYINRGHAWANAGELGAAISDVSVAIRLDPNLAEAWYCVRPDGPFRKRRCRFYRDHQVETGTCERLLQSGLGGFRACSL